MEDVGNQAASNSAYDYANLAAAMDDGDAASNEGGAGRVIFACTILSVLGNQRPIKKHLHAHSNTHVEFVVEAPGNLAAAWKLRIQRV